MACPETAQPICAPSAHFALEVDDWEAMLAHLDSLGVSHVRTSAASTRRNIGGTDPYQGRREDTGEHYTYIHDPDGNMIELVYHPLGIQDSTGGKAEVPHDAQLRWTQIPGFVTPVGNGTFVTNRGAIVTPLSPPRPVVPFKDTSFWAQGATLGVEFRY